MTFLPPLSHDTIAHRWTDLLTSESNTLFVCLVRVEPPADREDGILASETVASLRGGETEGHFALAGIVVYTRPASQTRAKVAEVTRLIVDRRFQRRGIARTLMDRVEHAARAEGKGLIVRLGLLLPPHPSSERVAGTYMLTRPSAERRWRRQATHPPRKCIPALATSRCATPRFPSLPSARPDLTSRSE